MMIESKSELYLVATPIGNLEDMTFRAVKILSEVDLIAAEDTRHTRKLLTHYDIHTPLARYDENNKAAIGPQLIEKLKKGESIACVSDAGLPAISDPGADLVRLAIEDGIKVTPIPGANAALSALICSGLDTIAFTFVGFLPRTSKKCHEVLERLKSNKETLIFYEAPHHLKSTLKSLIEVFGNRKAVIARELTKIHEEFIRGRLEEILTSFVEVEPRGEIVIVVEGNADEVVGDVSDDDLLQVYEKLIGSGLDKKSAMREIAKKFNISRRDIYQLLLENVFIIIICDIISVL